MTAILAACDGTNPFMEEIEVTSDTGETELIDANDPNTDVSNMFAYDPAQSLTMNSVEFDDNDTVDISDDTLIINNIPFDGPDGRYDYVETLTDGGQVYESRQTLTTGQIKHYAVYIQSEYMEATSASGRDWIQYGNAGANINRDSFALPGTTGEYRYIGTYAATRTFSERGGIEIVSGQVELILDELDFDPLGELQGDITGFIYNRERAGGAGAANLGDLPTIVLAEVSFNTETGVFVDGSAGTYRDDGTQRSTGFFEGMLGGPEGQEIGGYNVITGVADIQEVRYEIVEYSITEVTPVIDPLTGLQLTDPTTGDPLVTETVTLGVASGEASIDLEVAQALIDARRNVVEAYAGAGATFIPATLPDDAVAIATTYGTFDIETTYDAREIGAFIGYQQADPAYP